MTEGTDAPESGQDSSAEAVELTEVQDSSGLISTEYVQVEASKEEDVTAQDQKADASEGAEQNTSSKDDAGKEAPFHEHPRWQEMMQEKQTLRNELSELKGRMSERESSKSPLMPELKANSFENKTDEELLEIMTNNPKGFASDLATAIKENLTQEMQAERSAEQQKTLQQRQNETFENYFKGKEAELQAVAPDIQKYMNENPGHNVISAYEHLTKDSSNTAAIDAARAEERAKVLSELKAGKIAKSASTGGPASNPSSMSDPRLSNPDKHGGTVSVQLARFLEREQNA